MDEFTTSRTFPQDKDDRVQCETCFNNDHYTLLITFLFVRKYSFYHSTILIFTYLFT